MKAKDLTEKEAVAVYTALLRTLALTKHGGGAFRVVVTDPTGAGDLSAEVATVIIRAFCKKNGLELEEDA